MQFDKEFAGFKGDKKAFLDQRKKEKQQKEELKIKIQSCIKIQTYWRYKKGVSIEFQKKLDDFTKKIKDIKIVKQKISQQQQQELANKIFLVYPIFFETTEFIHPRNVLQYSEVLLEIISLLTEASQQSVMNQFEGKESKFNCIYRIVLLCLSLFSQLKEENQNEKQKVNEFLIELYKNCKKVRKEILIPTKYLERLIKIEENFNSQKGIRKSIKYACFTKPNQDIVLQSLLTANSFQNLLKNNQSRASRIFKIISGEKLNENEFRINHLRNRVNNYIQIWSLIDIDREEENVLQNFSNIFMSSLQNLVFQTKDFVPSSNKNEMEVEEENNVNEMINEDYQKNKSKTKFYKQFSLELSSINLSVFAEDKTIKLFCNMINHIKQMKPFTPQVLEKISQICGQFLMMSKIRNSFQLGLKIKLAQNFQLLKTLYGVFTHLNFDIGKFRLHSKFLNNVVGLFCVLFKKKLNLMDDEEFFGVLGKGNGIIMLEEHVIQNNFNLQEMKQIIDFFNLFAFKLLFTEAQTDYRLCEKKVVTLLKQLYSRDSRKKFYDNWILESQENQILLNNFNFKKVDEENSYMSRLLNQIPHIFTFEKRYQMMKKFITEDQSHQDRNPFQFYQMQDENDENGEPNIINSKNIFIQRGKELDDAFSKFHNKNMKALYKISFVDEHGFIEEGIDGGGIIKEFINSVVRQGFDPTSGLFIETAERTLMPAPNNKSKLARYIFLGKIVGKAIYENILIEPVFSKVFLNQILEKPSTLEDLQYVDKELYKMLMNLKHTKDNVEDYGLTFSIDDIYNGAVELKENGSQIAVTNENKYEYISLYAQYKLNSMNEPEAHAFREGFASVIDQEWLSMFNHDELQLIISGKFTCFDVQDLKKHTQYKGYSANDLTIILFWQILESFTDEEKGKFLHFVTSCSRPPTLGFKQLNPQFCIQKSIDDSNPQFPEKLPTSSTCMNILKLPDYKEGNKLKLKLLEAIFSGAGFDLS
ncbi:hypothetical protein ABPG72_018869 [Tetrahymena utriculariae]